MRRGDHTQDYGLGAYVPLTALAGHYSLLRRVLSLQPEGIALEFGVGGGESTRLIAQYMPVIGFDSFDGLPEDWRDGYPRGTFRQTRMPDVPNAKLVPGLFAKTLPRLVWDGLRTVGLVHVDCDLYSSTATVLEHVGPHLRPGCYVVFDEWHGYDGAAAHEQRAWREFAARNPIHWEVIGHSVQQWGIRIVESDHVLLRRAQGEHGTSVAVHPADSGRASRRRVSRVEPGP